MTTTRNFMRVGGVFQVLKDYEDGLGVVGGVFSNLIKKLDWEEIYDTLGDALTERPRATPPSPCGPWIATCQQSYGLSFAYFF